MINLKSNKLVIAYILLAIVQFIAGLLKFYTPIYLKDIGMSGFQIGLLFGVATITGLLFIFQIGIITDRISVKLLTTVSILLMATYMIGFSYTTTFIVLFMLFFLYGVGWRIFEMSLDVFALKEVHKLVGKNYGIYQTFKSIPFALALILGGFLLVNHDFSLIIRLAGFVSLLALFLIKYLPQSKKSFHKAVSYLKDLKDKRVIGFSILLFIFTLHWGVEGVSYSLFLKENLGLSFLQMGWFMSVPIFFLGAAAIILGKKFDNGFSEKKLILFSFLVSSFGFVMMALMNNVILAFIFRVIHEIGDGAFSVLLLTGAATRFAKNKMGGDYGLIHLVLIIGTFTGSLIFSPVGAKFGYHIPHIIVGSIIFISGFFLLFFKEKK